MLCTGSLLMIRSMVGMAMVTGNQLAIFSDHLLSASLCTSQAIAVTVHCQLSCHECKKSMTSCFGQHSHVKPITIT